MTLRNLLLSLTTALIFTAQAEKVAQPSSNPHTASAECTCPAQLIQPKNLLVSPAPVQADTFLSTEVAKVANVPITLYNFRQPARLNHQQLPFKIVLTNHVGPGALELAVDEKSSRDSWFLGYKWKVLVCPTCNNHVSHIGWKFDSLNGGESFFALIVRTKEDNTRSVASSVAEAIKNYLQVGVPASGSILTAALGMMATVESGKTSL
jgi:hypothetical protein